MDNYRIKKIATVGRVLTAPTISLVLHRCYVLSVQLVPSFKVVVSVGQFCDVDTPTSQINIAELFLVFEKR